MAEAPQGYAGAMQKDTGTGGPGGGKGDRGPPRAFEGWRAVRNFRTVQNEHFFENPLTASGELFYNNYNAKSGSTERLGLFSCHSPERALDDGREYLPSGSYC